HHDCEAVPPRAPGELAEPRRLLERLAAEERHTLDGGRTHEPRLQLVDRGLRTGPRVEHLGVAAARAADRAALHPHREAMARALGLGVVDDGGDAEHAAAYHL